VLNKTTWSKKRLQEEEENGGPFSGVEILAGSENMQYPWVAYTRENYPCIITASLANAHPSSRTHTTTAQNSIVKVKIPRKRKLEEEDEDKTP
jgi:hypothetical protein